MGLSSRHGVLVRDTDDVGLAMLHRYDTPQDLRRSILEDHAFTNDEDHREPEAWGVRPRDRPARPGR